MFGKGPSVEKEVGLLIIFANGFYALDVYGF